MSDDTSTDEQGSPPPVSDEPGSQAEGVSDLDDIRKLIRNTDSSAADIRKMINQGDLSIVYTFIYLKAGKDHANHIATSDLSIGINTESKKFVGI